MKRIWIISIAVASCGPAEVASTSEAELAEPAAEEVAAAREAGERWFSSQRTAEDVDPLQLREALLGLGYTESELSIAGESLDIRGDEDELWKTRNHTFGYFPPGQDPAPLQDAFGVESDTALRGERIRITLDRVKVQRYPGKSGTHHIAFNFHGQTQSGQELIPLSYSVGFEARRGDRPGVAGKSIFVGLNVGTEGVDLKGSTINVNTQRDRNFFSILAGNVFSQGLRILNTAQPAIRPLTELADGVTAELSSLDKGVPVQLFDIGLDLSTISSRIHLREGSYVILQIPPSMEGDWRWDEWQFANGQIEHETESNRIPNFNYIILGMSRM